MSIDLTNLSGRRKFKIMYIKKLYKIVSEWRLKKPPLFYLKIKFDL